MLWLEDKTILSIKQEIPQLLVEEKEVIYLRKKNDDDLGFENFQIRHVNVGGTLTTPVGC